MSSKTRLTLELSSHLNGEIQRLAEERGESKVDVLRDAIALLLTAKEAAKEGFKIGAWKTDEEGRVGRVQGRQSDREITCFLNNIGLGYQFAAVGAAVIRKAAERTVSAPSKKTCSVAPSACAARATASRPWSGDRSRPRKWAGPSAFSRWSGWSWA